ncbi:MAG: 4-hydroxy-3-methylbut-2-enyl diphosphate reductase [Planctomycetaceae bacterium]|nr:4-hydroxy-3-methylbut-2-enyl diphosphate reductase [Planctomycetaceae bacterium]
MRVIIAHISGFCDGVKRAMRIALAASEQHGGLQSAGPLVHNGAAVELLALHGITPTADDERAHSADPNSPHTTKKPMLVRAHGVSPDQRQEWLDRGLTLVDATCAHVAYNQRLVAAAAARGALVLLAGDADHAEVKAVAACAGADCRVVAGPDDIEELDIPPERDVLLLAQTTFNVALFEEMTSTLRRCFPTATVKDTICRATHERQREAERLADRTEAVVVVGGKNSANTRRLAEAVMARGKPAILVETADDLRRDDFAGYRTVGVTSGASTPGWLTQEVVNRLRPWGRSGPLDLARRCLAQMARARVTTALSAAGLAVAAQCALLGSAIPLLAVAVGAYVFFAHTLNRRSPVYAQARRWSGADLFYQKRRGALLGLAWAAAALCLACAALTGPGDFVLFTAAVLVTALYAYVTRAMADGSHFRIAAATLRNWVMALAWAVLVAVPVGLGGAPWYGVAGAGLWAAFVCLGGTLLVDLHDVASDRLMGIGTLPGQLGLLPARRLARGSFIAALCLSLFGAVPTIPVPLWGLWLLRRLRLRPVLDAVWLQAAVDCLGIGAGVLAGGALWVL